uniref:MFS transporter n=1 Tax=Cyberlindnera americana TaxID=36016 RepID=A0A5P8N8N6_9ASCO|nr:MFS transporter [Cyberlindnera americana]
MSEDHSKESTLPKEELDNNSSVSANENTSNSDVAENPHSLEADDIESQAQDEEPFFADDLERADTNTGASRQLSRALTGVSTPAEVDASYKTPMPSMGLDKEIPKDYPDAEPYTVSFDGPDDPIHPHNWPMKKKAFTCACIGLNTAGVAFGSSVFSPGITEVASAYHVGRVVATLGISLYVLGFATGPVIWAPLSELYGRRPVLILSCLGFVCFTFATATAKDIQTVMLCRVFAGIIGAAPLVVVPASFADLFGPTQRGKAITIFSIAVFAVPLAAPVAGAFIVNNHKLRWRWTEYVTGIIGSFGLALITLFFEETHHPIILVNKAREIKKRTGNWLIHAPHDEFELSIKDIVEKNISRPLIMVFTEPILFLISFYNAFVYGILYLLLTAYPLIFAGKYGMSGGVAYLPYFGLIIGMIIGGSYCFFCEGYYLRDMKKNGGKPMPESRLYPLFVGSVSFPVGMLWLTWTGNYPDKCHWMVPTTSGLFIGFGLITIFNSSINYVIDCYLIFAASAIAGNTFLRSITACAFPLFSVQMFEGMGINWAGLLLGLVGAVLIPVPFLFYRYGRKIREKSKYAFVL